MQHRIAPLFAEVNSGTRCFDNTAAYSRRMENIDKPARKPKILPVHREEAAALKALFEERAGMSQLAFAQKLGWSQGNVGHYLHARQPLNLAAALAFSRELNVPVSAFSPRLAVEIAQGTPEHIGNSDLFSMIQDFPPELRSSLEAHVKQLWRSLKGKNT